MASFTTRLRLYTCTSHLIDQLYIETSMSHSNTTQCNPGMAKASWRLSAIQDCVRRMEATEACPYNALPFQCSPISCCNNFILTFNPTSAHAHSVLMTNSEPIS